MNASMHPSPSSMLEGERGYSLYSTRLLDLNTSTPSTEFKARVAQTNMEADRSSLPPDGRWRTLHTEQSSPIAQLTPTLARSSVNCSWGPHARVECYKRVLQSDVITAVCHCVDRYAAIRTNASPHYGSGAPIHPAAKSMAAAKPDRAGC